MKTPHSLHVPHHPGLHSGPNKIEWVSLGILPGALAMILVFAFLATGPVVDVPILPFTDSNFAA